LSLGSGIFSKSAIFALLSSEAIFRYEGKQSTYGASDKAHPQYIGDIVQKCADKHQSVGHRYQRNPYKERRSVLQIELISQEFKYRPSEDNNNHYEYEYASYTDRATCTVFGSPQGISFVDSPYGKCTRYDNAQYLEEPIE
jgi:hypothetical protein